MNRSQLNNDIIDRLTAKLSQLEAQAMIISGESVEDFARWSHKIQGDYLWAIADGMRECNELVSRLHESHITGGQARAPATNPTP